ncbi:MAG: DNA polymerase III subunit [Candidatus Latescibacter sp.]|nr:DNA polymerase III subunit [Candidatus Latescibacter sp.]
MFDRIVGQENVKKVLASMLETGKIPHALLFAGPYGAGKGETALEFARMLLCTNGPLSGCTSCSACIRSSRIEHPDLHLLFPFRSRPVKDDGEWYEDIQKHRKLIREGYQPVEYEKNRQIVIDLVSEVQERLMESSFEGGRRVCIIFQADRLNDKTGNMLLKILEEPPDDVHFILTTERISSVLPTIVSRASVLRFRRLKEKEIEEYLKNFPDLTAEQMKSCALFGEGSIKTAKAFAFQNKEDGRTKSYEIYRNVALGGPDAVTANAAPFLWSREVRDAEEIINGFALCTRSVLELKSGICKNENVLPQSMRELADATNLASLHRLSGRLENAIEMLGRNVNISNVMTKLLYEIHDTYR